MNSTTQKGMLGVVLALSIAVVLFVINRDDTNGPGVSGPNGQTAIQPGFPQLIRVNPSSSIPSWKIDSVWNNGNNEGYTLYEVELLLNGDRHSKYKGGEFQMANACNLELRYVDSDGTVISKQVDVSSVKCDPAPAIDWSEILRSPLENPFDELLPVSVLSDFELFLDLEPISPTELRVELLLAASQGRHIQFDDEDADKLYFKRS